MAIAQHIYDDIEHFRRLHRMTIEILEEQHAALAEIAKTPLLPSSALEMKSRAEQALIKSYTISQSNGGE